jgi:hypothetical protein
LEAVIPADATTAAPHKISLNDKFCLMNVFFSDELTELALRSEESAMRAELDAELVGHNSPFWRIVEARFNEGFPSDGANGMAFADLIHHLHPLFHQNSIVMTPSDHGIFSAEKLMSVRKELLKEYDTILVNFTKSGNHKSLFTKAAMVALQKKLVTQVPLHLIQNSTMMMTLVMLMMTNSAWKQVDGAVLPTAYP